MSIASQSKTMVIGGALVIGISCSLAAPSQPKVTITYFSLWDDALEQHLVVGPEKVGWAVHKEQIRWATPKPSDLSELIQAAERACVELANERQLTVVASGQGDFAELQCAEYPAVTVNLLSLGYDTQEFLKIADVVFGSLFRDYVQMLPIGAGSAAP